MPRGPRLVLPNVPLHVIQRGNNRQPCFFAERDYRLYLDCLKECTIRTGCLIHAYALMTNHVHLLVSSTTANGLGALMKAVGQRYVQYVNRAYDRSGTLWEGRFRSCLVQDDAYLLTCQRYIEMNPVRAGMVARPENYRWSSYRANALGEENPLVSPHPLYLALDLNAKSRRQSYRELFNVAIETQVQDTIRHATNGNYVLGDACFRDRIAHALGRRAEPSKRGRPLKAPEPESRDLF